ncbi:MAG: LPS assembly lipoprotein LptE [Alphaproteobacteria bacterium]|nr:LPS assembly lipoprotein LptE [Alphaproteobacteria bacterium]
MKKLLTLLLALTLASCGWTPMYDSGGHLRSETRDIYIVPISGTNGIDLRNTLRASWGTVNDTTSKYILSVDLKKPETILKALQITGDATWREVRMTAKYELRDRESGDVILSAFDTASESYAFVSDLVAAQASYNNAVQNAIRVLANKIETRVNAKLIIPSETKDF